MIIHSSRLYRTALICAAALVFALHAGAQSSSPNVVTFDATRLQVSDPTSAVLASGTSPDGRTIAVNSRYLLLNGKPWLAVMGEFHYSRFPEKYWEEELLKMKAGGVQIVATYVFWIHHEEVEGQFDWSGQRDLRHFVELCRKHGLYVVMRIGPWAHGEARNGGFPDWLLKKAQTRRNDPAYLSYVQRFYDEIAKQLQGLYWKNGGSIVAVQLENEYVARGEGRGAAHIAALKKLAQEAGIQAPIYTVTGWMNPEIPEGQALPVFGGYPDAFWSDSRVELPPSPNYFFTAIRDDGGIATDLLPKRPTSEAAFSKYPYLLSEAGGGMELAYHRRPVISPDDVAAITLTKLGSGANLYGYYMFHGGTNPEGKLTTLQESQVTGYANDLPVKSYDFQAPLREFGQMNASFRRLKLFHYFLNDFGADLAPTQPVFPQELPKGLSDRETLRAAVRLRGDEGFLFVNNYQRTYTLPGHKGVQFSISKATGKLTLPRTPITVPSGAYFVWPLDYRIDGIVLKYATAQPLAKLVSGKETYLFLFAQPGIAPELAFDEQTLRSAQPGASRAVREGGVLYVMPEPGTGVAFTAKSVNGRTLHVVVLTQDQAENCWKATLAGQKRLVMTHADFFSDGQQLFLRNRDAGRFDFAVFPSLPRSMNASVPLQARGKSGIFDSFQAKVTQKTLPLSLEKVRDAGPAFPVRVKRVAEAPSEDAFNAAATWKLKLPQNALNGLNDVFLRINYTGDIARFYAGGRLVTDDFYYGAPWEIGLKRLSGEQLKSELEIKVLPLRQDAPIYLAPSAWPKFPPIGETADVRSVTAFPEYQVTIDVGVVGAGR